MAQLKFIILMFPIFLSFLFQLAIDVPPQTTRASENKLAALAESMPPGTFALLNREGDGSGWGKALLSSGGSNGITGFASKMAYDAGTDRVYFSGGEHGGETRTIYYDIPTNKWVNLGTIPIPPYQWGHAYDSNAIIPSARELWANSRLELTFRSNQNLRRLNLANNTWSLPPLPRKFYETEPSMEYFPERDELLWLQGGWLGGLAAYKKAKNSWTTVYSGGGSYNPTATGNLGALQLRGAILRYIPQQHAVYIMGGVNTDPPYPSPDIPSHAVYKYDQTGRLTRLKDFPSSIWMYTQHFVAVVDPPSGELIVVNAVLNGNWVNESGNPNPFTNTNEMWRYSPANDSWTKMDISVLPDPNQWWIPTDSTNNKGNFPFAVTTVTVPNYGVTLFTSAVWGVPGRESRVYVYKHSSAASRVSTPPPPASRSGSLNFDQKCAQAGVISCYGFDSAMNLRNTPDITAPYPFKYNWDSQGTPCSSLGMSYPLTRDRGPSNMNARAFNVNGTCYYPTIDTAIADADGGGAMKIEVPSGADQNNGGYFDTTYRGIDQPPARVGPDNGGEVWFQFRYRAHNMVVNNFGGSPSFQNSFTKTFIHCSAPPGKDYCGSDNTLSLVLQFASNPSGRDGWHLTRRGMWSSYTRAPNYNVSTTERNGGGTVLLQNAVQCSYVFSGSYNFPPCVRLVDDQWLEITHHLKLNPVATNFSVSGTTLSRAKTFNAGMVGRWSYIAGDGYYQITAFIDSGNVTLSGSPAAGSNKTVYISGTSTGTLQEFVNGLPVVDARDQIMTWDSNPAGWGEIRLLPHQTGKISGLTYTPGTVWYDDLIISTQAIPMSSNKDNQRPR